MKSKTPTDARVLFPLGATFCYWEFLFSRSKASDANVRIIANFVYLWENSIRKLFTNQTV